MRSTRPRPTRSPLSLSPRKSCPAPKEVCVTETLEITVVECEDEVMNSCFNVATFIDATNTNRQKVIIIRKPSCCCYLYKLFETSLNPNQIESNTVSNN